MGLPSGKYIVANAGYALTTEVVTPYPIDDRMSPSQKYFNHRHSRTRITVERTIGMWKNRFRVLKMFFNESPIYVPVVQLKFKWPDDSMLALLFTTCSLMSLMTKSNYHRDW